MTVAAIVPSVQYAGNGSSVAFAAPFRFFQAEHLIVRLVSAAGVSTTLMLGVDYTVAGGATDSGGTVTMSIAPASGTMVEIDRVTPREQATDYLTNDTFPAETHEAALDRGAMIEQEQQAQIDRTVRVPVGEDGLVLPRIPDRLGGRVLGFDDLTGEAIAVPSTEAAVASDVLAAALYAESAELDAAEAAVSRAASATSANSAATNALATAADRAFSEAAVADVLAATLAGKLYRDTTIAAAKATGLAAVADGASFAATGDDVTYIELYVRVAGVADPRGQIPTFAALDAAIAAATIANKRLLRTSATEQIFDKDRVTPGFAYSDPSGEAIPNPGFSLSEPIPMAEWSWFVTNVHTYAVALDEDLGLIGRLTLPPPSANFSNGYATLNTTGRFVRIAVPNSSVATFKVTRGQANPYLAISPFVEAFVPSSEIWKPFASEGQKLGVLGDSISDETNDTYIKWYRWLQQREMYAEVWSGGQSLATLAYRAGLPNLCDQVDALPSDLDRLIVYAGINDQVFTSSLGNPNDTDKTTVYGALNYIGNVARTKMGQRPISFMTPMPYQAIVGGAVVERGITLTGAQVSAAIVDRAAYFQFHLIPLHSAALWRTYDAVDRARQQPDGVHHNSFGHLHVDEFIATCPLHSNPATGRW